MIPDNYIEILRKYWGYDNFRGIQSKIIESISSRRDTLGLMPTGGGKSITFQVPALAAEGMCLVITPLIALMKDQVTALKKHGIPAAAIYSGMSRNEINVTLDNCVYNGVKILYVSPERLSTPIFQTKLRHTKVSFITVDEAHCISQWGYDFRPSYLQIADIRKLVPDAPVLALTATATPNVVSDIQDKLNFKEENVIRMSFERTNLAYIVRRTEDKEREMVHILKSVRGSAIIYTRSRKRTREIAKILNEEGISALFYHAGLDNMDKDIRQTSWMKDETRIIVATTAFGMGIDKPDVRLVIHADVPDSIEAYFQEAGRAGRDGKKSYAVLLYNPSDRTKLSKRVVDTFPDKEYIGNVYEHLAYFYQIAMGSGEGVTHEFNIDRFCQYFHHFPIQVNSALNILSRAGYIEYSIDNDNASRVMFIVGRNELYRLDETNKTENRVIESMLRNYGGMFADYVYIDESLIALGAHVDTTTVHQTLKHLSSMRIIHYIPASKQPLITYTQRREDLNDIVIPKNVYEERKTQYVKRIHAMIDYATSVDTCRSRMLLNYFGENAKHDCGQCDICLEQKKNGISVEDKVEACNRIMGLLADGKHHHITEFQGIYIPKSDLEHVLEQLISEEKVMIEDGMLWKTKP